MPISTCVSQQELEVVALSSVAHGRKDGSAGLFALQAEVVGGAGERRLQSVQETSWGALRHCALHPRWLCPRLVCLGRKDWRWPFLTAKN